MSNVTLNVTVISWPIEHIEEFAAAQLLGPVFNWCLYGALIVQFYVYSYNFPGDNRYIKILVYSIFFLETVQTALSGADLYNWFAAGFGNFRKLIAPFASFKFVDVPIMGSVVSLSVQFFFAYRIFVLSEKRSWWLCVIICLLSIVGASGAFSFGIFSCFLEDLSPGAFVMTWIIGNMLSDLFIVSAMLYHLRKIWVMNGSLSSHVFVSIVRLTVETNLVTTTVSFVALLIFCLKPDWNWYMCPAYILGKLYSNTLLVSLNNRISIRKNCEARGAVVNCEVELGPRSGAHPRPTTDIIILEPEKSQNDRVKEWIAEAGVEERVNSLPIIDIV